MLKCWQSDGFIFYCMGIVLLMLALYVLSGEAVVRRAEFTSMGNRTVILEQTQTQLEQRLTRLETPKKHWWQR